MRSSVAGGAHFRLPVWRANRRVGLVGTVLALPILVMLFSKAVSMLAYARFVTVAVMGRNYDAAVIAAGQCGFGLGATPTAIANMQAVIDCFGPSGLAFLVVPMVGAFFIDIANVIVIKLFVALAVALV